LIFLVFESEGSLDLGVKTPRGVVHVRPAAAGAGWDLPVTMGDLLSRGPESLPAFERLLATIPPSAPYLLPEDRLTLGPVVPNPGKILCVGLNYRRHAAESGAQEPKAPVLFSKFANSLAASGAAIDVSGLSQVDYEAELGVVLGRGGKNIPENEALGHVFGYCNTNDLSERSLQFVSGQWLLGKTLDRFLPVGPYLVTADEVGSPQALAIRGWLNGEQRQSSSTADMIFSVAQIISYASRYMTLEAGDLISTGTPEGVILGRSKKVWMKAGDEYVVEIGNLGRLTNRLTASRRPNSASWTPS
jgi:2-keto-4-pentenoate hydratase/2-oxohepta-3-ene-1,7-dioic acid hydratase in catechol pathway